MRRLVALCSVALGLGLACERASTQTASPTEAAPVRFELDTTQLFADLDELSTDEFGGRYSANPESIDRAAALLVRSHTAAGLQPVAGGYRVPFTLPIGREPGDTFHVWANLAGESTAAPKDQFVALAFSERRASVGMAAIVGPGAVGPEGVVAVLLDEPESLGGDALAQRLTTLAGGGAAAAIIVGQPGQALPTADILDKADLPAIWVSRELAATWLGTALPGQLEAIASNPKHIDVLKDLQLSLGRADKAVHTEVDNVVAVLPGSDLASELVIIGAHYDHIGTQTEGLFCNDPSRDRPENDTDDICNGADDNASGTAAVLAIARTMAAAGYRPRRTLVFAHFAGEEFGLVGSAALANEPPAAAPFEGGRVVAMLNMDMVGRLADAKHGLEVGGLGTHAQWETRVTAASPPGLLVHATDAMTGRSDHASYAKLGVPVLFFFTGLHGDYHRTSDEADTVDRQGLATITTLVMNLARTLGDGAQM